MYRYFISKLHVKWSFNRHFKELCSLGVTTFKYDMKKMLIKQFRREMGASGFPRGKKSRWTQLATSQAHLGLSSAGSDSTPCSPGESLLHQPVVTTQRKAQVLPERDLDSLWS